MLLPTSPRKSTSVIREREFREVVERERARAERYGGSVSIVEFRPEESSANGRGARVLGETLRERLRETDHVGWLEGRVAVVLPDTDRNSATRLASELVERIRRRVPSVSIAIDSYGG